MRSNSNYLIKKVENGDKTNTTVTQLDEDGKVQEIVRLTGGGDKDVAILNAKSSIFSANEYKKSI